MKIYADDVGQAAVEEISVSIEKGWELLNNYECARGCVFNFHQAMVVVHILDKGSVGRRLLAVCRSLC